jgi:FtsH-binding integral membrane protein
MLSALQKELVYTPMVRVYKNVFLSILTSFLTVAAVYASPALMHFLYTGPMLWVSIFAPLPAIMLLAWFLTNDDASSVVGYVGFLIVSSMIGVMMGPAIAMASFESVATALSSAAVLFGSMAVYGAYTRRDLSSWGDFLMVGLIALIFAGLINIFVMSSVFSLVISGITIIVFMGFTAYDVQKTQEMLRYSANTNTELLCALNLYLDFINLFLSLLNILSSKD